MRTIFLIALFCSALSASSVDASAAQCPDATTAGVGYKLTASSGAISSVMHLADDVVRVKTIIQLGGEERTETTKTSYLGILGSEFIVATYQGEKLENFQLTESDWTDAVDAFFPVKQNDSVEYAESVMSKIALPTIVGIQPDIGEWKVIRESKAKNRMVSKGQVTVAIGSCNYDTISIEVTRSNLTDSGQGFAALQWSPALKMVVKSQGWVQEAGQERRNFSFEYVNINH
jgi:hypothetical protein